MERGKIIVIEGTDCSGKETQSKILIERLEKEGIKCTYFSFPQYETPTGKIIGGPCLGKEKICEGWFPETFPNVDSMVSCLYFAADRRYNAPRICELLNQGYNVILDRYTYSNMAHQGGKMLDLIGRKTMYKWIETLEFGLLQLPQPDIKIFLHVPYDISCELKKGREESLDENERDENHLIHAERAYIEVAEQYNFDTIECTKNGKMLDKDVIAEEIYKLVKKNLNKMNYSKQLIIKGWK